MCLIIGQPTLLVSKSLLDMQTPQMVLGRVLSDSQGHNTWLVLCVFPNTGNNCYLISIINRLLGLSAVFKHGTLASLKFRSV